MSYYVYILECRDGTLYTGITNDIQKRFAQHKAGTASKYTRSHGASRMVYIESSRSKSDALKREIEIKKLPRAKKLLLKS
jgi:putative endonuclease